MIVIKFLILVETLFCVSTIFLLFLCMHLLYKNNKTVYFSTIFNIENVIKIIE